MSSNVVQFPPTTPVIQKPSYYLKKDPAGGWRITDGTCVSALCRPSKEGAQKYLDKLRLGLVRFEPSDTRELKELGRVR